MREQNHDTFCPQELLKNHKLILQRNTVYWKMRSNSTAKLLSLEEFLLVLSVSRDGVVAKLYDVFEELGSRR